MRVDELERRPLEPRGDVALYCLDGASLNGRVERPSRRRVDKNDGLLCLFDSFRLDLRNVPLEQPAGGERGERVVGAAHPFVVEVDLRHRRQAAARLERRARGRVGDVDDVVREARRVQSLLAALAVRAAERAVDRERGAQGLQPSRVWCWRHQGSGCPN